MIRENQRAFQTVLLGMDAAICVLSMLLAYWLRFGVLGGGFNALKLRYYMQLLVLVVPMYFLIYHYFELHNTFRYRSLIAEFSKLIEANAVGVLFVFLLVFFLKEVNISRLTILLFGGINTAITCLQRVGMRKTLRAMRRRGYNQKHILMVGWNEAAGEFYDKISANRNMGYQVTGYLSNTPSKIGVRRLSRLGSFSDLLSILEKNTTDEVVISLDYDEFPFLSELIEVCEKAGVKSSLLPFYTKYLPTKPHIDEIEGLPLINLRSIPLDNFFFNVCKRGFDFFCSLFGLLVLSPVLLATALGVKLTSPGPVIYRQARVGLGKKEFMMYKFRSMRCSNNPDMTTWGTKNDDRRTAFGTFIRKYSLDELPQLFNVLCGDMSLVGPRPERPFFVEKFREEVPLYMLKHLVRPGITGWAQVHGWRGDTSIVERVKCDIFYIENWTFLLDIKILLMTVFHGLVNHAEEDEEEQSTTQKGTRG